jgi:hypothetical protein
MTLPAVRGGLGALRNERRGRRRLGEGWWVEMVIRSLREGLWRGHVGHTDAQSAFSIAIFAPRSLQVERGRVPGVCRCVLLLLPRWCMRVDLARSATVYDVEMDALMRIDSLCAKSEVPGVVCKQCKSGVIAAAQPACPRERRRRVRQSC